MRRYLQAIGLALLISLLIPINWALAAPFPTVFDGFEGTLINPDNWLGITGESGIYEVRVSQSQGRLRMESRGYGNTSSDSGVRTFVGFVAQGMTQGPATPVTAIQMKGRVDNFKITACAANPDPFEGRSFLRLFARWFNAGSGTDPADLTDAIHTFNRIDILPGSSNFQVNAVATRCNNADCSSETGIYTFTFSQTVIKGQDVEIGIDWDAPNNRIIFSKDAQTAIFNYALDDSNLNIRPSRRIEIGHHLQNCHSGPRTTGFIKTAVDEFRVKP